MDVRAVIVDRTDPAAEQIRWYIDGRQFFQVNEDQVDQATWTAAVHHGYSIIFDLASAAASLTACANARPPAIRQRRAAP